MTRLLHTVTRSVSERIESVRFGEFRPAPTLRAPMSSQSLTALCLSLLLLASAASAADEPFRPEAGKFPPLEKAHSYRGELVFVDHAMGIEIVI